MGASECEYELCRRSKVHAQAPTGLPYECTLFDQVPCTVHVARETKKKTMFQEVDSMNSKSEPSVHFNMNNVFNDQPKCNHQQNSFNFSTNNNNKLIWFHRFVRILRGVCIEREPIGMVSTWLGLTSAWWTHCCVCVRRAFICLNRGSHNQRKTRKNSAYTQHLI